MVYIESMYSIMKAVFAYNFNRPRMKTPKTNAVADNKPQFGGPTSAFSPYKVHDEVNLPEVINQRKDAFRRLKAMFGMSEPVGTENYSTETAGRSQK
jgi:hypothetical protein